MKAIRLASVIALCASALGASCKSSRPIVLVDASPTETLQAVDSRIRAYEQTSGRRVSVLRVPSVEAALDLAGRGDADVALVPERASLDAFLGAKHGKVAGRVTLSAAKLAVLEVDPAQHPKVDGAGAHALAESLLAPGSSAPR